MYFVIYLLLKCICVFIYICSYFVIFVLYLCIYLSIYY